MIIKRQKYIDKLCAFTDHDLIKVITGVRRCGKSTLLDMMREHLLDVGVDPQRVLSYKMESMEFGNFGYKDLYELVRSQTTGISHPYLFFDELQEIDGWERAINALRVDMDCDIYITGSNAYLLSSELSTLLSGRYVEIEMLPLVFAEYLEFRGVVPANAGDTQASDLDLLSFSDGSLTTTEHMIDEFRTYGGFPLSAREGLAGQSHAAYMKSLCDTVIIRDILERDKRKGRRQITNPSLLQRICAFLADNVGNENSVNSIASTLRAERLRAANDTVDAYIAALCEAYLFYPVRRYDIKGRQYLKTLGKHYIVDTGLRNYLEGYRDSDQGRALENLVFLQLLYDGWDVSVGKLRDAEVDFVVQKPGARVYVQVSEDMSAPSVMERELAPLLAIRDAYPKCVIVLRGSYPVEAEGVRILTAADFFLHRREIAG